MEDQDIIAEMFNNVPRPLLTFSCFEPEESYNSCKKEIVENSVFALLMDVITKREMV